MKVFVQSRNKSEGKYVVQGLVPFIKLMEKAIFTQKAPCLADNGESDDLDVRANADYYQRRLDPNKLKKIQKYIINAILDEHEGKSLATLFPSSMILATDVDTFDESDIVDIQLGNLYVVDGQHRLMAMKKVYEELTASNIQPDSEIQIVVNYLKSYKFNCTILLNYDLWEQGQVFANVNFTQKPVNRSLYYEIFGTEFIEDPRDWTKNYIYLAHQLTRFMNENLHSPFRGKIKMLGNGSGYVSQAFFVEALTRHFKNDRIWGRSIVTIDGANELLRYAQVELLSYYVAVQEMFSPYWGTLKDGKLNFICKTTGTGAFLRLLEDVHWEIVDKNMNSCLMRSAGDCLCDEYVSAVKNLLNVIVPKQDELFGPNSKFGGTGGKGLEVRLYAEMRKAIQLDNIRNHPLCNMTNGERERLVQAMLYAKLYAQLHKRGIRNVDEQMIAAMNDNLPSEIGALGYHCSVENVENLTYSNSFSHSDSRIQFYGDCNCIVRMSLDSDESDTQSTMSFPTKFSFEIRFENDKWEIDSKSWDFRVNTNKYYL